MVSTKSILERLVTRPQRLIITRASRPCRAETTGPIVVEPRRQFHPPFQRLARSTDPGRASPDTPVAQAKSRLRQFASRSGFTGGPTVQWCGGWLRCNKAKSQRNRSTIGAGGVILSRNGTCLLRVSRRGKVRSMVNQTLKDFIVTRILPGVTTPAQYIGGELNSTPKDHREARGLVCLAFPDTYASA